MPLNIPITIGDSKPDIINGTTVDCVAAENIKKNTFVYADNVLRLKYQEASAYGSLCANIDNNLVMAYYKTSYSSPAFTVYNTEQNKRFNASIDNTNILYDYHVSMVYLNEYMYVISTSEYNTGSMRFVKYKVVATPDSATITTVDDKSIQITSKKITSHTLRTFNNKLLIYFYTDSEYMFFASDDLEIISPYSSLPSSYDYFDDYDSPNMYKISDTLFAKGALSTGKASMMFGLFEIDSSYSITMKYSYVYTDHHYGDYNSSFVDPLIHLHGRFFIFGKADVTYNFTRFMLLEFKDDTIITDDEWTMDYTSDNYAYPSIYTMNDTTFLWIVLWRTTTGSGNYYYEMKKYVFSIDMDSNGKYRIYVVSHFDYDTSLDTSKNYEKFPYNPNLQYVDINNSYLRTWYASGSAITYCEIDLIPHIKQTSVSMLNNVDSCIGMSLENIIENNTGKVSIIKGGFI